MGDRTEVTPFRPTDRTATELAALVRDGEVEARELVATCLERIAELDDGLGAFQLLRGERALEEAAAVDARGDRQALPLAGVPVAVKDNVDVAGEPTRLGCPATSPEPAAEDHEVVHRLRSAGAVVVGKTRLPELGVWGTTDSAFGVTRNPWNPDRTPGGSSGGSAAAVAAGMVPAAHGNDGLGSIRIPAAACGLVGLKPGADVVPAAIGRNSWFGLAENGPLATSVADAALLLSVMAARPELREPSSPERPLRVALSTRSPVPGVSPDSAAETAASGTAELLADAGHRVVRADPPYPLWAARGVLARWFAGTAREAEGLDAARLESRTRRHAALGRLVQRLGLVRSGDRARWRHRLRPFFDEHDVLLTPALAASPPEADRWGERSWMANMLANTRFAPYTAPWNLAGFPAAAVPAGRRPDGLPAAVQLVAPAAGGAWGEALLLSVARQLEERRPWPRRAAADR